MAIDRNNNPMLATSTTISGSIFFSTPCIVERILWTSVASSLSLHLTDMKGNRIFDGIAEAATNVIDTPIVLANGLRFRASTTLSDTNESTSIEGGKLFVFLR